MGKYIGFRVSDQMKEAIDNAAARDGRTASNWIKRAIETALQKNKRQRIQPLTDNSEKKEESDT